MGLMAALVGSGAAVGDQDSLASPRSIPLEVPGTSPDDFK
jgi:hypothetical protein